MRKAEATDNVLFDRFWVAYPKKVGKEKARRAFEKLHPTEDLLGQMLEAIAKQRRVYSWNKATWKYIPHPATWLNQKRWEDEVVGETIISEDGCYVRCIGVVSAVRYWYSLRSASLLPEIRTAVTIVFGIWWAFFRSSCQTSRLMNFAMATSPA